MKWHRRPILPRSPSSNRREPLLKPSPLNSEAAAPRMNDGKVTKVHVAEAVGVTAAECAAVCCCCPCGIVNLVVLVGYRVPASLCRKALRRRRRRELIKKGLLSPKGRRLSCEAEDGEATPAGKDELVVVVASAAGRKKDDGAERLEKEMWERFYNTGFWRSPSQREEQQQQKKKKNKSDNQDKKQ